ncbi:gamma carbonic anhydrase family protein [Isoptericola sp. NPDC019693]|uniref:gamma carbonic anhydrase family protein n=1 Tax=Isoptericola sp. NPDC019693 TaxID=3364009 RepID=UPI003793774C
MATVLPFDGHTPEIHPTAWVAPTATIVGNVRIGARASVFYGAVLRGDMDAIELGEGSNIQDNCVVHTDTGVPATIGAGVGVGHGAIIHGATVGDGSLVGMGATLLNGSVVGEGAFVAAGALVREGQEIPAGHLAVGVPAKDRGPLDAEGAERVRRNAIEYQELAERHRRSVG